MSKKSKKEVTKITLDDESGVTRRGFVKVAIGGVCGVYGVAVGYPVYKYLASPVEKSIAESLVKEVELKDADKLPKGGVMMFKFGSRPSMLIHHLDDIWVALDAVCTHLGCTVQYNTGEPRIHCACHGGQYDPKTGENLSGPPPKPLRKYVVKVSPGVVTISRT